MKQIREVDVNLEICSGEILGIAGVAGNGQQNLAKLLSGHLAPASGKIFLNKIYKNKNDNDINITLNEYWQKLANLYLIFQMLEYAGTLLN